MAVCYSDEDTLVVYVQRGELAPARRAQYANSKNYWALITLQQLADAEEEHYPVTCYIFQHTMIPAIQRIFNRRGAILECVDRQIAEDRVADVIAGEARALNDLDKLTAVL